MKLVSVNAEGTKTQHDVTFNLDSPVDPETIRRLKFTNISLTANGLLLRVQVRGEEPISRSTVRMIEEGFQTAAAAQKDEADRAAREHQRLLDVVKGSTGLDVR